MRLFKIIACVFIFALSVTLSVKGDTVVLKTGQKLIGDIIAEKQDKLYIDIGVTVLAVLKQDILEFNKNEPNNPATQEPANTEKPSLKSSAGRLYYTADNDNTRTIEQCVAEVAEAVVKVSTPAGLGSGFFINQQGYLITNYHVIEKETKIDVTVFKKAGDGSTSLTAGGFDKKVFKNVRIEALNPFVDLALLKVEDLGDYKVSFVPLGDVTQIRVGQPVFAIGNPLGLERTVTNGVISSTGRPFEGLVYLQTNADINPGNSGGPLFNLSGQVIGVTNRGYIFFGGLGFAIPVDYVKHFIDNRESFAYDKDNPNTGYRYIQPAGRRNKARPVIK
jgi:serine protease Do